LNTDKEEPTLVKLRTDTELPTRTKSNALIDAPHLVALPLIDTLEENDAKLNTEKFEPNLHSPNTLMSEPTRALHRRDIVLAKFTKSNTETLEPILLKDLIEVEEAAVKQPNWLVVLPNRVQAKTEQFEPSWAQDLMLNEDPK
jgi:hypothetical protein